MSKNFPPKVTTRGDNDLVDSESDWGPHETYISPSPYTNAEEEHFINPSLLSFFQEPATQDHLHPSGDYSDAAPIQQVSTMGELGKYHTVGNSQLGRVSLLAGKADIGDTSEGSRRQKGAMMSGLQLVDSQEEDSGVGGVQVKNDEGNAIRQSIEGPGSQKQPHYIADGGEDYDEDDDPDHIFRQPLPVGFMANLRSRPAPMNQFAAINAPQRDSTSATKSLTGVDSPRQIRNALKRVTQSDDVDTSTSASKKKRTYKTEREKKAAKPEITDLPPKDEWLPDKEILHITAITNPITRHYKAPYAFSYWGRLLSTYFHIADLQDAQGEYLLSERDGCRVIDNYETWIQARRNHGGLSTKGAVRQRLPKTTKDLHINTAGSAERGRFRKAVSTDEGRQLARMARDDLLHHAYYKTAPIKLGAAEEARPTIKKTGEKAPHKRLQNVRKEAEEMAMRA